MVKILINPSKTETAIKKEKLISELWCRADNSNLRELLSYKNDLLALDDLLKEIDKDKK